jgi:hypothetical protein
MGGTEINLAMNYQNHRQNITGCHVVHPKIEQDEVINIYETDTMSLEIQTSIEHRFDLSAPITMTSLWD